MLKKGLLASAILALTCTSAFANGGSYIPPTHSCAWYIGGALGGEIGKFRQESANGIVSVGFPVGSPGLLAAPPAPRVLNAQTSALTADLGGDGISGELNGGVSFVFLNRYTLGLELFGSVTTLAGNIDNTLSVTIFPSDIDQSLVLGRIKQDYTVGFAILPGLKISDSSNLYLRVGVATSRFKLNYAGISSFGALDGIPLPGLLTFIEGTHNDSRNRYGLQLGVGMSTMICPNIALRGEYRWERFNRLNANAAFVKSTTTAEPPVATITEINSIHIKPTVQSINLGLTWFFHVV